MELMPEEIAILRRHGYSPSQVFDGRELGRAERRYAAKDAGCELILATSCTAGKGHRLTTRSGHCFQCNPKQKAFEKKHGRAGYVYIAGSKEGKLLKIGATDDVEDRTRTLCSERYAGCSDWKMLARVRTEARGKFEDRTLELLSAFGVGDSIRLTEARRCSFEIAFEALQSAVGRSREGEIELLAKDWRSYEFR